MSRKHSKHSVINNQTPHIIVLINGDKNVIIFFDKIMSELAKIQFF